MRTSVDVHNYLVERGAPHELVPVQGRLREPERTAAVLGVPGSQVGRVILYAAEEGRGVVAAVVRADRDADGSRVAGATGGGALERMTPEDAADLTGFLPEAIPPAGLPDGTAIVIDDSLSDEEVLYLPGGEPTSVLKIRPADLIRAVEATVAAVQG